MYGVPSHWLLSHTVKVRGRNLTPGREVSIVGLRGRFRFVRHVVNTRTNTDWLDFVDANGQTRSFYASRVRRVHTKATMRATKATVAA